MRWTLARIARLHQLVADGVPLEVAAAQLGVTATAADCALRRWLGETAPSLRGGPRPPRMAPRGLPRGLPRRARDLLAWALAQGGAFERLSSSEVVHGRAVLDGIGPGTTAALVARGLAVEVGDPDPLRERWQLTPLGNEVAALASPAARCYPGHTSTRRIPCQ